MNNRIESIELVPGIFAGIYQDDCARNPWEDGDDNPPLISYSGRYSGNLTEYGEVPSPGELIALIPAGKLNSKTKVAAVAETLNLALEDVASYASDFNGTFSERHRDAIAEVIARYGEESGEAYLDQLETLAGLAGVPCYRETSRGDCQGDWAEIITFALPGDKDTRYNGADPIASLKASASLWGSWAWGHVYGYQLEDADGEAMEYPGGSHGGSCWGFYGDDHEASGLLEHARNDAECLARAIAKEEAEREALAGYVETTA